MENTRRTQSTKSARQGAFGFTEMEVQAPGLAGVCTRSSACNCSCLLGAFVGLLTVGVCLSLTLLPVLGALFLLRVAVLSLSVSAFALSYCILFCQVWLSSLRGLLFSEGRQRHGSRGERRWWQLGEVEGGENVVRMYCMGEQSIFNFKKRERKNFQKQRKEVSSKG